MINGMHEVIVMAACDAAKTLEMRLTELQGIVNIRIMANDPRTDDITVSSRSRTNMRR